MSTPPSPLIEADRVTKRFGDFTAVDTVSFEVGASETFGLLGSNGAGKSTMIRILCGLLRPSGGSARVLGIDIARNPEAVKRRIGYMTQRFSLYPDLTVRDNLVFYGGIYGLSGSALQRRLEWAVETTELRGLERRLTGDLPGGWKQRLGLACALLHEPQVVFLDEPTGGADPHARRRFWRLIEDLRAAGVAIIVTTHYLDEAEHCGRVALMHGGRLVALGSVSDLKEAFAGRVVLELAHPRPLEVLPELERESWALEVSVFGSNLHVVVSDADDARTRLLERFAREAPGAVRVEPIVPSLEDVFIHYIEREDAERAKDR